MKRNALRVLVAGVVLFLVGAVGGPILGSDTAIPVWLATWVGILLLPVAGVMFLLARRKPA